MDDERCASLRHFEEIFSYEFRNIDLLDNALIHRSFIHENPHLGLHHNERLEFLGDAVLQVCMTVLLMEKFTDYAEGQLSQLRASFVNERALSELAKRFSIGDYILLGRGEVLSHGRMKISILANAFEAVMGAIFLDGGFEKAQGLVARIYEPLIDGETMIAGFQDYKTALQEASLRRYREIPQYTLIGEYGPDHDRIFEVKLTISSLITAAGMGRNKKEAEQQAARKALEIIHEEPEENGGSS